MNDKEIVATRIAQQIINDDQFGQWLGIELNEVGEGYCKISMRIRPEMINAVGIVHGGIPFSIADSAFAIASNNHNNLSVSLEASINFIVPIKMGDTLTAHAIEVHNGQSTGFYQVTIYNQLHKTMAVFKGTCFRTGKAIL